MRNINLPWMHCGIIVFNLVCVVAGRLRHVLYLTGQHNVVPEVEYLKNVTHVALAFMRSEVFNEINRTDWPLFTTVEEVRSEFPPNTIIQVAIGGWGNTDGFSEAARTDQSRQHFAENIKAMLDTTGADGVDIDWEYPGGNGEDYKRIPNSEKVWEIEAFPLLLSEIRAAIGPSKVISAAVPGLERDMIAFTKTTVPKIMTSLDFINVMTYDLMNRRDNVTKLHTGFDGSFSALVKYNDRGVPGDKMNLGLAYYVKWFKTAPGVDCSDEPISCPTELMEDPVTGDDLGKAGAFSWHDEVPSELSDSFSRALNNSVCDEKSGCKVFGGGQFYWDREERIFWTWDTPVAIQEKISFLAATQLMSGIFAWGIGEDAPKFEHFFAADTAWSGTARNKEHMEHSEL